MSSPPGYYTRSDLDVLRKLGIWNAGSRSTGTLSGEEKAQLKRGFRAWAINNHPDKGGNQSLFQEGLSAMEKVRDGSLLGSSSMPNFFRNDFPFPSRRPQKAWQPPEVPKTLNQVIQDLRNKKARYKKQPGMFYNINSDTFVTLQAATNFASMGYTVDWVNNVIIPPPALRKHGVPHDLYFWFMPPPPTNNRPASPPRPNTKQEKRKYAFSDRRKKPRQDEEERASSTTGDKGRPSPPRAYKGLKEGLVFNPISNRYVKKNGDVYRKLKKNPDLKYSKSEGRFYYEDISKRPNPAPRPNRKSFGSTKDPSYGNKRDGYAYNTGTSKYILLSGKVFRHLIKAGWIYDEKTGRINSPDGDAAKEPHVGDGGIIFNTVTRRWMSRNGDTHKSLLRKGWWERDNKLYPPSSAN